MRIYPLSARNSVVGGVALATGLLLNGCAPAVKLEIAPSIMSTELDDERGGALAFERLDQSWAAFGSPALETLIARGQEANPDIAIAVARIAQARADLGIAKSANGPVVSTSASASSDIRNLKGQTKSLDRIGSAGLDISYDVDLFGGTKAAKKAAWARLKAAGFDKDALKLIIESDIASAYVQFAALSDRARLMEQATTNARALERVIRLRAREGVASQVDVGLQATEGNAIEIGVSRIIEAKSRSQNGIAVLLGEEAPRFKLADASISTLRVPQFALIQPAEIVTRRPDIIAAEARIAAANGDVAQARAAFMPSIQLSASSFFDIARSGGLVNAGASGGFGLFAAIFDSGRLKSRVFRASAEQKEAVETYRKIVLVALAEAQNALAASSQTKRRYDLLVASQDIAAKTAALARQQYVAGSASMNAVLDADRRLVEVQDSLVLAKQESLNAAILLYRALGGAPRSLVM